jgi:hypothetical protein
MIWLVIICIVILALIVFIYFKYNNIMPHQVLVPEVYKTIYPNEIINFDTVKNKKICFSVAGYNCNIPLLRERLEYLVQDFQDYRICIYALDSTSKQTIQDLHNWKNPKVHLVPIVNTKNLQRIIRIGTIRSTLLEYTKKINLDSTWNCVIYDSDHIGTMSKIGLIDAIIRLEQNPELYAICASGTNSLFYGLHFLYDTFAYLNKNNVPGFKCKLHSSLVNYTQIISGFSGASLYRYADLVDVKYDLNPEICEHVVLHKALKSKFDRKYKKECFMEMSKKWHIYIGLQPSNN